jgi:DNA-binding transcriptional ArsR family regulator
LTVHTGQSPAAFEEVDRVFLALAHEARRQMLILLAHSGGELPSGYLASRFPHSWPTTSRHLKVLEDAGLVITRRSGREKLHFLNPVPIRLVHDRWIDKYTEHRVSALTELKKELETSA